MMKRTLRQSSRRRPNQRPSVIGSGLLALDVVISDVSGAPPRHWAGGTCGNVLTTLGFLGWEAHPVARLKAGPAAQRILIDLKRWGVSPQFVSVSEDGSTPVIVERIVKGRGGIPRHTFSWRCPDCGSPLPAFKPVLTSVAEAIGQQAAPPRVFFFDRATSGGIALAKTCAAQGALVVFEPSSIGNPVLFRQAWEVCHVVKYSHERLRELPEIGVEGGPRLQVETLGEAGLRYRKVSPTGRGGRWSELQAVPVERIKDTAGAGDWCTAGLIDKAGRKGAAGLFDLSDEELRSALRYGQALAAWNCEFEGARGGMYAVDHTTFVKQVTQIIAGERDVLGIQPIRTSRGTGRTQGFCQSCVRADDNETATGTYGRR